MKSIKELRWLFWQRIERGVDHLVGYARRFSDWVEKVERESFREYYDSLPKRPGPDKRSVQISVYFYDTCVDGMAPTLWKGEPFRLRSRQASVKTDYRSDVQGGW